MQPRHVLSEVTQRYGLVLCILNVIQILSGKLTLHGDIVIMTTMTNSKARLVKPSLLIVNAVCR